MNSLSLFSTATSVCHQCQVAKPSRLEMWALYCGNKYWNTLLFQ